VRQSRYRFTQTTRYSQLVALASALTPTNPNQQTGRNAAIPNRL